MSAEDDAVRERHGCACREDSSEGASFVTVWETDGKVHISANSNVRNLTQWQARYLASKLYRLARRIRQRTEEAS